MNFNLDDALTVLKVHGALADEEDTIILNYIKNLNKRIEKAVEYMNNTEDMCYYGKCNDGDLLIEVEEDFKNDLLNILRGEDK